MLRPVVSVLRFATSQVSRSIYSSRLYSTQSQHKLTRAHYGASQTRAWCSSVGDKSVRKETLVEVHGFNMPRLFRSVDEAAMIPDGSMGNTFSRETMSNSLRREGHVRCKSTDRRRSNLQRAADSRASDSRVSTNGARASPRKTQPTNHTVMLMIVVTVSSLSKFSWTFSVQNVQNVMYPHLNVTCSTPWFGLPYRRAQQCSSPCYMQVCYHCLRPLALQQHSSASEEQYARHKFCGEQCREVALDSYLRVQSSIDLSAFEEHCRVTGVKFPLVISRLAFLCLVGQREPDALSMLCFANIAQPPKEVSTHYTLRVECTTRSKFAPLSTTLDIYALTSTRASRASGSQSSGMLAPGTCKRAMLRPIATSLWQHVWGLGEGSIRPVSACCSHEPIPAPQASKLFTESQLFGNIVSV
eukprot:314475-Prorocentrum_minimum.AAC.1